MIQSCESSVLAFMSRGICDIIIRFCGLFVESIFAVICIALADSYPRVTYFHSQHFVHFMRPNVFVSVMGTVNTRLVSVQYCMAYSIAVGFTIYYCGFNAITFGQIMPLE